MSADLLSSAFATFVGQRRAACASNVLLPQDSLLSSRVQPTPPSQTPPPIASEHPPCSTTNSTQPCHNIIPMPNANAPYGMLMQEETTSVKPLSILSPSPSYQSTVNSLVDAPPPLKRLRTHQVDYHANDRQHQELKVISPVSVLPPSLSLPPSSDSNVSPPTAFPSQTPASVDAQNVASSSSVTFGTVHEHAAEMIQPSRPISLKRKLPPNFSSPSSMANDHAHLHTLATQPLSPMPSLDPTLKTVVTSFPSMYPISILNGNENRPTQMSPISSNSSQLTHPMPISLPPHPPHPSFNPGLSTQHSNSLREPEQLLTQSSRHGVVPTPLTSTTELYRSSQHNGGQSVLSCGKSESVSSSSMVMTMVNNNPTDIGGIEREVGRGVDGGDGGDGELACNICKGKFLTEEILREHKRAHGRPFACARAGCSASFSKANHLSRHVRIVHNKERPFACDEEGCGARFGSKSHLGDHTRAVHMRLRTFKCHMCDASWSKRFNLEKHIRIRHYGEKPFRCTLCRMSFGTRSHVTRHEVKVHKRQGTAKPTQVDQNRIDDSVVGGGKR